MDVSSGFWWASGRFTAVALALFTYAGFASGGGPGGRGYGGGTPEGTEYGAGLYDDTTRAGGGPDGGPGI